MQNPDLSLTSHVTLNRSPHFCGLMSPLQMRVWVVMNSTTTQQAQLTLCTINQKWVQILWNYGVSRHLLQYIYFCIAKTKTKQEFFSPDSSKLSLSHSLATVVAFIPILLGSKKLYFTVWKKKKCSLWGQGQLQEEEIGKLCLWVFLMRICRLYLLNGDELWFKEMS